MGARVRDIERMSAMSFAARHPFVLLPPNDVDYFAAFVGTAFSVVPFTPVFLNFKGCGAVANITVSVGPTATGFVPGETVTFEFEGVDEFWDPVLERLTIQGNGQNIQQAATENMFTYLNRVSVVAYTGNRDVSEVWAVGYGNGQVPSSPIRIPHPFPGTPHTTVQGLMPHGVAPLIGNLIAPSGTALDGRALVISLPTASGSGLQLRFAVPLPQNLDSRTVDHLA